jgi:hypothetical protein
MTTKPTTLDDLPNRAMRQMRIEAAMATIQAEAGQWIAVAHWKGMVTRRAAKTSQFMRCSITMVTTRSQKISVNLSETYLEGSEARPYSYKMTLGFVHDDVRTRSERTLYMEENPALEFKYLLDQAVNDLYSEEWRQETAMNKAQAAMYGLQDIRENLRAARK